MRNPYEVLGLPENATDEQVREAYRNLARRYQQDMAEGNTRYNPAEKMDELDKAYDAIIMSRSSGFGGQRQTYASSSSSNTGGYSVNTDFSDIRIKIQNGRFDDAEMLLDGIPEQSRTAEWYYLKGSIQYRKGWLEEGRRELCRRMQNGPRQQGVQGCLRKSEEFKLRRIQDEQ